MKELSRGTAERVDGKISSDNDGDRIEDWAVDILGRRKDDFIERIFLPVSNGQLAIDVLHHHDRAVDDYAEVNRADREQVRGDIVRMQNDEREQQRQRNGERNNEDRKSTR